MTLYHTQLLQPVQALKAHSLKLPSQKSAVKQEASQKCAVKQEDPVQKFFSANAHFIRTIWCSLPFYLSWELRSHTSFSALRP